MLQVGDRRKIKKSDKITVDMWGKTGIITEVKGYKRSPPPVQEQWYPIDDRTFNHMLYRHERDENRRERQHVNRYFLKFWVPNRCVGLWVTEQQVEEV